MQTYTFDKTSDIITFIDSTDEFLEFETIIASISTQNGLNLNINTNIIGLNNNIQFKYIKDTFMNFYNSIPEGIDINLMLKIKISDTLKNAFDEANEYNTFYVIFIIDKGTIMCQTLQYEKDRSASLQPIMLFEQYFATLYNNYYNKYILNNKVE